MDNGDRTVSVVLCDNQVTFVYSEELSTLDRINAVTDMLDLLRTEASALCAQMMGELSGEAILEAA